MRGIGRLVLATEEVRGSGSQTAQDDVLSVNDVPLASHIAGLRAVRTHFAAFFFSGWVLRHGITEAIVQLGTTMAGALPVCRPLVTAPGNLGKGLSHKNERANTQRRCRIPGVPRTGQNEALTTGPTTPPRPRCARVPERSRGQCPQAPQHLPYPV
ncbi:conserved hypothetical protein [Streptomyces sviceus ATCC 29083]|uniref:Uncharacterized protein n=1 Tax=Streptomyces sviceus (strain ATCC 29083 / DSM 924 / JCM 4929 / NBRC 13980 / NCIMB 11184 / NRRL 5439 / UC 5370) TaxID=463191 RepID=B5HPY9_STRX2|nr:conserved hypothetical protein [Streptomyces sviceus ATCC 29083]